MDRIEGDVLFCIHIHEERERERERRPRLRRRGNWYLISHGILKEGDVNGHDSGRVVHKAIDSSDKTTSLNSPSTLKCIHTLIFRPAMQAYPGKSEHNDARAQASCFTNQMAA